MILKTIQVISYLGDFYLDLSRAIIILGNYGPCSPYKTRLMYIISFLILLYVLTKFILINLIMAYLSFVHLFPFHRMMGAVTYIEFGQLLAVL